jgi:hypothetical protein
MNKSSPFSQMNKTNRPSDSGGYRSWKQKEEAPAKVFNPTSITQFPDLIKAAPKKSVFEGASLATKLKDAIAAEEEEAIQKRLKKGTTPETILREMCVSLPLKGGHGTKTEYEIPSWVTDTSKPMVLPCFKLKTLKQLAEERRLRRLGINPYDLNLNDDFHEDDDVVSLPSEAPPFEEEDIYFPPHEDVYGE